MERTVLRSTPWYPVTGGCLGMVQCCTRAGSDWTFGCIYLHFFLNLGWLNTKTVPPESWLLPQAYLFKRHLDNSVKKTL